MKPGWVALFKGFIFVQQDETNIRINILFSILKRCEVVLLHQFVSFSW